MNTSYTRDLLSRPANPIFQQTRASARETQPWTTTRCHRLLRPLKTHISALRRDVALESSEDPGSHGSIDDGSSGVARGKFQYTYSRRGRKPRLPPETTDAAPRVAKLSKKRTTDPGEIVLPTPVIRRVRGQQLSSPVHLPSPTEGAGPMERCRKSHDHLPARQSSSYTLVSALELEMLPLRNLISSSKYSLYESILRALHALLVATTEPAATEPVGSSKSLMAMCLRKIPDYIGELEDWEERQAEENGTRSALRVSEISNEVYEAVADTLPPGRGCPQLRLVVRAHGIRLVRMALLHGLLEDSFSLMLIKLCTKTKAQQEAEDLLAVHVDRSYPKPKGVDSTFDEGRRLDPLRMLRDFARETCRPQFMLKQLSSLVLQQQLPLEWLSTKEFSSVWSSIVKTFSENDICDETVNFAIHMITVLSSQARTTTYVFRPESRTLKNYSQQTLLSAITAIAALPLLRQEGRDLSQQLPHQIYTSAASRRVAHVIHACIHDLRRARKSSWILTALRLAAYFTCNTRGSPKDIDISGLWHSIIHNHGRRDDKQHYQVATAIICSLAQCCGRGSPQPSHRYLTEMCDTLDTMADAEEAVSRKLRIDCAFFLAEKTNDLRDLAFAESFNTVIDTGGAIKPTPEKKSSFTGFRWDEGISEWVTATPAVQKNDRSRRSSIELTPAGSDSVVSPRAQEKNARQGPISTVRVSSCNPGGGLVAGTPKRALASTTRNSSGWAEQRGHKRVLLRLPGDDDGAHDGEPLGDGGEKGTTPQLRPSNGQYRGTGKENSGKAIGAPRKRRRVSALKPRRSILDNVSNVDLDEASDDELGL